MDREKLCDDTKKKIRSTLISSPNACTIKKFDTDYRNLVGEAIPYRELGFTSLEQFLYSLIDVARIRGRGPDALIEPVINEKTAHINKLVVNQKTAKVPKRFGRAPRKRGYSTVNAPPSTPPITFPTYIQPLMSIKSSSVHVNKNSNNSATSRSKTAATRMTRAHGAQNLTNNKIGFKITTKNLATPVKSTTNQSSVPLPIQNNLKRIIDEHKEGILGLDLPQIYMDKFRSNLNYSAYGYRSQILMIASLPDIFQFRQMGREDYTLYPCSVQLPASLDNKNFQAEMNANSQAVKEIDLSKDLDFGDYSLLLPKDIFRSRDIERVFLPDDIKVNDSVDVVIAEIYDLSKFWLYLRESSLDRLMDEMQEFYNENHKRYEIPEMLMVEAGTYCVHKFLNEFHRAIVVGIIDSATLRVYFFDYGTMTKVSRKGICYLTNYFAKLPAQGIRCRLANLKPVSKDSVWPTQSIRRFKQLVTHRTISAKISSIDRKDQMIEVYLADMTESHIIYINDVLVEEGYAVSCEQDQREPLFKSNFKVQDVVAGKIHLFPTFGELEYGLVPCEREQQQMLKEGVPVNFCLPLYFTQREDTSESDKQLIDFIAQKQKELDSLSEKAIEHDYDFDALKEEEMDFSVFGAMKEEIREFYRENDATDERKHICWDEINGAEEDEDEFYEEEEESDGSDEEEENFVGSDENMEDWKRKQTGLSSLLMDLDLEESNSSDSGSGSTSSKESVDLRVSTNPFLSPTLEEDVVDVKQSTTNPFLYDFDESKEDVPEEKPKPQPTKSHFVPSSLRNLLTGIDLIKNPAKKREEIEDTSNKYELLVSSSSSSTTEEIVPVHRPFQEQRRFVPPQPQIPTPNPFIGPSGPSYMPPRPPVMNYYREWVDMYGNCVQQVLSCSYAPNRPLFRPPLPPVPYPNAPNNFSPGPIGPPPGFFNSHVPQSYDFYNSYNNSLMENRFPNP